MSCLIVSVYNVHSGFRLRSIVTAHMNVLPHNISLPNKRKLNFSSPPFQYSNSPITTSTNPGRNHPPTPPSKKTTEYPQQLFLVRKTVSPVFFCVIVALFLFVDFPYFHQLQKKYNPAQQKKNGHHFGFYLAQTPKKSKKNPQKNPTNKNQQKQQKILISPKKNPPT